MLAQINGKQIERFMNKIRNDDESELACKMIAIKCAFFTKNVDMEELDNKTRDLAIESCKAAFDLDEKSDKQ